MAYESLITFMSSPWLYLLLIWALVWKGLALWKSARNKHLVWFIFILVTNTVGILSIIYLIIYRRKKKVVKKTKKRRKT
jgi:methionyl-tRNA synthetase